jgi:hypothetical protein
VSDELDRALKAAAKACFDFAEQVRQDITEMKELEGDRFDMNSYGNGYDHGALNTAEKLGKEINRIAAYWPAQALEDD